MIRPSLLLFALAVPSARLPGTLLAKAAIILVMGTSVAMIERHYGALLDGAHAGIVGRLDALEAGLEQATEAEAR